jgi:putative transposase
LPTLQLHGAFLAWILLFQRARKASVSSYLHNHHHFNYENTFAPFAQGEGLPFPEVLTKEDVARITAEEKVSFGKLRRTTWTPAITMWGFIWQVLGTDKSCRQTVANVMLALALAREPDNLDTGLYCRARAKIPARVFQRLALHVGHGLERVAPEHWLWQGRHVKLIDGSTSALADTAENQKEFPQAKTQKKGLGFPLIRWVALLGLATGAIQGFAYGAYAGKETGETALFRELLGQLQAGDIVLADRYYCSYFMIALLQRLGVDVVMRMHQKRKYDFRRGQRLGEDDHVVEWHKPPRPAWMSAEEYAEMPETIGMREIRRGVEEPGYRVKELVIATTLLDAKEYAADEVATLYAKRWHVELDIRSLKTTLGMNELRCQTPFMLAKEIWAHILAYNLVRKVGAQVAAEMGVTPRSISFKAVRQALLAGWQQATELQGTPEYVQVQKAMLRVLRKQKVGHRPGRCEPRAVKGRPKSHKLLMEPRAEARAKLLKGTRTKKDKKVAKGKKAKR